MAPSPVRRAILIAALLLAPLSLAAPQAVAASAGSTGSAGSSAGDRLAGAHDPDWMRRLPDDASLASLSVPGTHDTMTAGASIVSQTQDASLPSQLDAGVRALDIRTRHFRDAFSIHHGPEYLHANFTDVVREVADFLRVNPTETVLMRLKSEDTEAENTRSYQDTLNWYLHDNPDTRDLLREHLWTPPAGYDGSIPTLGQTRGRIVILQDFSATTAYGPKWGGNRMDIQDDYVLSGLADVPRKWDEARAQFERAGVGSPSTLYVNHLSATGVPDPGAIVSGALPVTIADGALGVTGMNARAVDYLAGADGRTGVVMTDFPTAALVAEIIAHNDFR
ncbi:phosphatidylinositol-specific phospholipase C [Rhodococcus spelaei]|uniref:1-phosphatidylinositol phosphodiesterase n=1 Tax=Rhodococcus spelaei TaxID=2546320 RepID=A0A541B1T1_9NOCA|nr:phosphatidylinositol-specific phospholipase C [Rhodococcus spelaei]TQF66268.1 phosphatidylinositol-specific phospholipase C [Rhodococcus spelaei]